MPPVTPSTMRTPSSASCRVLSAVRAVSPAEAETRPASSATARMAPAERAEAASCSWAIRLVASICSEIRAAAPASLPETTLAA